MLLQIEDKIKFVDTSIENVPMLLLILEENNGPLSISYPWVVGVSEKFTTP